MVGYAFATTMVLSYAAMIVIIRENGHVSMLPAACLSAFLCAFRVLPFAQPMQVTPPRHVRPYAVRNCSGGTRPAVDDGGTRLISATRSALIGSLENPLALLWVWLAFEELPAWAKRVGGSLVMDVLTKSRRRKKTVEALAQS